jgi:3,4-dihydroxy-2-butanone 4-phosphate synthase
MSQLSSIEEVIAALQAGKPVLVSDAEDRENEGDAIIRHPRVVGMDDSLHLGVHLRTDES